jgi:peptide/nickel transport system permease protein
LNALGPSRGDLTIAATRRLRRRALAERNWALTTIAVGAVIVLGMLVVSLAAPLLGFGHPNHQNLLATLQPPSFEHPFGTDGVGRDVFTRVLYATRLDFQIGVVTAYAPLVIGMAAGAIAGYYGGLIDAAIMRLVDLALAFPFIILVLAIVAIFGAGQTGIYVGLITVGWGLYARLTRAEMLVLRERQFIMAAQTLGFSTRRILLRHALPNLLRSNLVFSMADIVLNILVVASLSYFGLGIQVPTPEWGAMVAEGQTFLLSAWWISTLPGLVIVLAGVGFSLLGDGIADFLGEELRISL